MKHAKLKVEKGCLLAPVQEERWTTIEGGDVSSMKDPRNELVGLMDKMDFMVEAEITLKIKACRYHLHIGGLSRDNGNAFSL
jgi:hypothetical protein